MPTDLALYNNNWYQPGSAVKRTAWHYVNCIFFKSGYFPFYGLKVWLLKLFGAQVGNGVLIKPFVNIKYPWHLVIGQNVWIGENVWIDNLTTVQIGNNVCVSQGAMLLTGNHNYKSPGFELMIGEIFLEDGVWIGAQSIVCPGVICKSHAVLAVAAVATQNLEPYYVYAGNPAIKLRVRTMEE